MGVERREERGTYIYKRRCYTKDESLKEILDRNWKAVIAMLWLSFFKDSLSICDRWYPTSPLKLFLDPGN